MLPFRLVSSRLQTNDLLTFGLLFRLSSDLCCQAIFWRQKLPLEPQKSKSMSQVPRTPVAEAVCHGSPFGLVPATPTGDLAFLPQKAVLFKTPTPKFSTPVIPVVSLLKLDHNKSSNSYLNRCQR